MTRIKHTNITLLVWFSIFFVILTLISANVFVVAVGGKHLYSKTDITEIAKQVYIKEETLLANRGMIVDRNNNVLAQDVITYKLILYLDSSRVGIANKPAYVVDKEATANALAPILNMDEQSILDHLNKQLYQTELGVKGRNLTLSQKNEIQSLELPGLAFETMISRNYPLGVFASHLIGFSQYDEELQAMTGRMGLEASFNKQLLGSNGWRRYQSDISGFVFKDMINEQQAAVDGNTLMLTLDKGIQETLELSFEKTMEQQNAHQVWGLVMEVESGNVLGWGHAPGFDPNAIDIDNYDNVISQQIIEPGSTMKSFVYATAIDLGKYRGDNTYASGAFHMGISNGLPTRANNYTDAYTTIYNAGRRDWGIVDFDRAYAISLNTAIATLLTEYISVNDYENYLEKFGFFQPVEMVGVSENVGQKAFKYPVEMITSGYGQGSTVTTLQLMQAYSAIFNDGVMLKPKVVDKVIDSITGQVIQEYKSEVVGQPINTNTAKEIQRLMKYTADAGTARHYQIPEVSLLGKTGTANVVGPNGYYTDRNLYSVVLALPADDPQVMVYYGYIAPNSNTAHNETGPVQSLLRKISMTYNLQEEPIDEEESDEQEEVVETKVVSIENFINRPTSEFVAFANLHQFKTVILGDGDQIINTSFNNMSKLLNTTRLFVQTNKKQETMIDLIGFSKKEVMIFAQLSGVDIEITGDGWVSEQSLVEGEVLSGEKISVVCTLNP